MTHFMHLSKTNPVVSGKKAGFFAQGKLQLISKKCLHFKLLVLNGSALWNPKATKHCRDIHLKYF